MTMRCTSIQQCYGMYVCQCAFVVLCFGRVEMHPKDVVSSQPSKFAKERERSASINRFAICFARVETTQTSQREDERFRAPLRPPPISSINRSVGKIVTRVDPIMIPKSSHER